MIFTWMIPKVVGRSEPSPWHLLRELERETTKESELEKLRKQVSEAEQKRVAAEKLAADLTRGGPQC